MTKIKITVIVPICDTSATLLQNSLQSVLDQKIDDIEILCVDNGSSAQTLQVVESLASKDCRIRIVEQLGGELGELCNCGLKQAQGDYVLFLDGGELIACNGLQRLLERGVSQSADVVAQSGDESQVECVRGRGYDAMGRRILLLWSRRKIYRRAFLVDGDFSFPELKSVSESLFLRGRIADSCVVCCVDGELFGGQSGMVASHEWFYYALTALGDNILSGECADDLRRCFINYVIEFSRCHVDRIDDATQRTEALALLYKLDRKYLLRDYAKLHRNDLLDFYFNSKSLPWLYDMAMEHISTPQTPVAVDPTKEGISILIPVYNVEEYVELSVRSVLNQSYDGAIQIICINDGSTDRSLEVLQRLAAEDSRVEIIDQPNAGQGVARNRGMKIARHERIMFLDSDDFFELDAFDLVSTAFGYDTDLIIFSYKRFGLNKYYAQRDSQEGFYELTDEIRTNTSLMVWDKVWRRSIIEKYNIEFPAIRYEDTVFLALYFVVAKDLYLFVEKPFSYRLREDSTMGLSRTRKASFVGDFLTSVDILFNKLVELNLLSRGAAMLSRVFKGQIYGYIGHTKGRDQREGYKRAKEMLFRYEQSQSLRAYNFDDYIDKIENGDLRASKINHYKLLRLITLLTIKENSKSKRYLLFGWLPIYKIKISGKKMGHYIFALIPIFKRRIATRE